MKFNQRGLNLIKKFEGLRLRAYPDPGTGGAPWTIGYGHTKNVTPTLQIREEYAEILLNQDIASTAAQITPHISSSLNDNQYSALICFAFNCGAHNLIHSTLMDKVNAGDFKGAAEEFGKWIHAAGKVLPGLVARRKAERELFESNEGC